MRNCPPPPSDPVATGYEGGADAIVSLLLCQAKDNISAFHSSFGGKIDFKKKEKKGHTPLSTALAESQS